ncbi:acetyl-CoA synthetase [archaeon]|nr:acetyl-CoA synthetase [archaeon]
MKKYSEYDSRKLLEKYKIPIPEGILAKNGQDAVLAANKVGYPCIMKIISPDILHKSDVGGVVINILNETQARDAFLKIISSAKKQKPDAKIDGVLIEKIVIGKECIVGASRDPQFGSILMFGLGGIFVEVLKDVTFRLIPIEKKDAHDMIREIKAYPILEGIRGEPPVDISAIEKTLLKVSKMVQKEKITELDINPLIVNKDGVICADCRMIFE